MNNRIRGFRDIVIPVVIVFIAASIAFEIQSPLFATTSSIAQIEERPTTDASRLKTEVTNHLEVNNKR